MIPAGVIVVPSVQVLAGEPPVFYFHGAPPAAAPWKEHRQTFVSGNVEDGAATESLSVLPVAWRARWCADEGEGDRRTVPYDMGRPEDGWRSRVHILGWTSGQLGMAMLTFSGACARDVIAGLRAFDAVVYAAAEHGHGGCYYEWMLTLGLTARQGDAPRKVRGKPAKAEAPHAITVSHAMAPPRVIPSVDQWIQRRGGAAAIERWRASW